MKKYNPPNNEMISRVISAPRIAIDIESKDPNLREKGSGCYRKDGYICGLAVASDPVNKFYLPFRHPDVDSSLSGWCRQVASDILATEQPKLGANIGYDLEWLEAENFIVGGPLDDVQLAEPLLDEYRRSYALNNLAKAYDLDGKKSRVLEEYCETMGWKYDNNRHKAVTHIWRMPARIAAEYAIYDVELPLEIFKLQRRKIEQQQLTEVYGIESKLIRPLTKMRQNGVRLDMDKLKKTVNYVTEKHFELSERLAIWAGSEINFKSSAQLSKVLDRKGIAYARNEPTERMKKQGKPGNPKLDKEAIARLSKQNPELQDLLEWRKYDTTINMFLIPYLDFHVDGRLHCNFNSLRSDEYGTVSGRFSSSRPNLQQVSAKSEGDDDDDSNEVADKKSEIKGQIIRQLFIPEDGCDWAKADYSQIEYRIIAHYAMGPGSEELRQMYNENAATDFHQVVQDQTGFDRRTAKRLNFGGAYGMGVATTANKFDWTMDEAELFMSTYHRNAPYVKRTRAAVASAAKRRGYIFTVLGRRARMHPSRKLHSMFNRLIQGSAADVMKKAMVDCDEAGIFDALKVHITVHDELDPSVPRTQEGKEALDEMVYLMENAVKFDVPLLVDCHTGHNWAEAD